MSATVHAKTTNRSGRSITRARGQSGGTEGERAKSRSRSVTGTRKTATKQVAKTIKEETPEADSGLLQVQGVLELHPKGYGFLRDPQHDLRPTAEDAYLSDSLVESLGLQPGNSIRGLAEPRPKQQGPRVQQITEIDGCSPEDYKNLRDFDDLTPINPDDWLRLETGPEPLTTRVMDLLTPLGKGQRALIVAPPRSGKTIMLQHIGQAIAKNYPAVKLMVMLIDERPEEVTDMRRQVPGEIFASSLDQDVESHTRLSQLVVERAKRMAARGHDVLLLIDSLTRMSRAFNKRLANGGRTMTGGIDIRALDIPKKLFASARAFEEGGSLTIVATTLVETGSRMDDLIFQEFKGTGNMELVLDQRLADRRIWPAIDVSQSGTRREEKLLTPDKLEAITTLRRTLSTMQPVEAMERLIPQLARFQSNDEFLNLILNKTRAA